MNNCLRNHPTQHQQDNNGARRLAKPKLELFASHVADGNTLVESYKLVKPGTTHDSAAVSGSRWAAIPGVRARITYLREQIVASYLPTPTTPATPQPGQATPQMIPMMSKEMLQARLLQIANSKNNRAALSAIKVLHRWIAEDEKK